MSGHHVHEWKAMDPKRAYPATSGIECFCGQYRLGWMGNPPNTKEPDKPDNPGGELFM